MISHVKINLTRDLYIVNNIKIILALDNFYIIINIICYIKFIVIYIFN